MPVPVIEPGYVQKFDSEADYRNEIKVVVSNQARYLCTLPTDTFKKWVKIKS